MQIIESSYIGLRTVRYVLKSKKSKATITLFPMVHVGESSFYEAVYNDAFSHDYVLTEGVKSPYVKRLTRSYKWIGKNRRLGLCVQPPYPKQDEVTAKIIHADLSPEIFNAEWQKIALKTRIMIYSVSAFGAFRMRWILTREMLAKNLSMDDLPSRNDYLSWNPESAGFHHLLMEKRDQCLIEKLNAILENTHGTKASIAIVYGAMHMRAVLREFCKQDKFYVSKSDWITVFKI